jgi:chemotaxis protein methyltransferase CheR
MNSLTAFAEEEFEAFRDLLRDAAGLKFDASRREALRLAVRTRALACGDQSFRVYLERLHGPWGEAEFQRLLDLVTIQETSFFRNPEHFQALARPVLNEVRLRAAGRPLRIWSAGCATGEEAYSIGLSLLEAGVQSAEVVGTDVSEAALETARAGCYTQRAVRLVPRPVLDRYFDRVNDQFVVGEALRRIVRFEHLNLIRDPFPTARFAGCDVVFCRNVIIYFTPESVRRIVRTFAECLLPGGALFLGPSETLWQLSTDFELAEWGGGFYYRRRQPVPVQEPGPAVRETTSFSPSRSTSRRPRRHARRAAPARSPASPRPEKSGLDKALEALRTGDAQGATAALEATLADEGAGAIALVILAYLYLSGGRREPAADLTRRALAQDPLCPDVHLLEGLVAKEEGRNEEALAAFRRALYLEPASALARYHLGQVYAVCGQRTRAEREFAEVVRLLEAGAAASALSVAYPAEALRHACRLAWDKCREARRA